MNTPHYISGQMIRKSVFENYREWWRDYYFPNYENIFYTRSYDLYEI